MLYGIPYPGVYMTDGHGIVVAKSFHQTYKMRDSPEALIDATLGRVRLDDLRQATDVERTDDDPIRVRVGLRGGRGTIRQGIVRHVVAHFELGDGFHLYGRPVPDGMVPTRVEVSGPPGLVVHEPIEPETETLHLASMGMALPVWSGAFEIVVPFHAVGELASETRPLDVDSVSIEVAITYQACDDEVCLLPTTKTVHFDVPLDVIDIPKLDMHRGHGQREGAYDATPHLKRLLARKVRQSPLGFVRHLLLNARLELAAWWRRRRGDPAAP